MRSLQFHTPSEPLEKVQIKSVNKKQNFKSQFDQKLNSIKLKDLYLFAYVIKSICTHLIFTSVLTELTSLTKLWIHLFSVRNNSWNTTISNLKNQLSPHLKMPWMTNTPWRPISRSPSSSASYSQPSASTTTTRVNPAPTKQTPKPRPNKPTPKYHQVFSDAACFKNSKICKFGDIENSFLILNNFY